MASGIVEPRRGVDVGRVVTDLVVENFEDVSRARRGEIPASQIRSISLLAMANSGATYLCLPKSVVQQLELTLQRTRESRTLMGTFAAGLYAAARVQVSARDCVTEVKEIPDGHRPLPGQIPLEMMDFWIDLAAQKLVGNPEYGGEWMAEVM